MKKSGLLWLFSFVLCFSFHCAQAMTFECPPGDSVKTMTFTQAGLLGYPRATTWNLITETFKYNHRDWNVFFILDLPAVTSKEEAFKQGLAAYAKLTLDINHPLPYDVDGMSYCDYTPNKQMHVTAVSAVQDGLTTR